MRASRSSLRLSREPNGGLDGRDQKIQASAMGAGSGQDGGNVVTWRRSLMARGRSMRKRQLSVPKRAPRASMSPVTPSLAQYYLGF